MSLLEGLEQRLARVHQRPSRPLSLQEQQRLYRMEELLSAVMGAMLQQFPVPGIIKTQIAKMLETSLLRYQELSESDRYKMVEELRDIGVELWDGGQAQS